MHKVRTDLEELKQDLSAQRMEIHLLEGKLLNQEDLIANSQSKAQEGTAEDRLIALENRLKQLEHELKGALSNIKELTSHAGQTNKALTQYKSKIAEMEKNLSIYGQSMREVAKLRKNLSELSDSSTHYIVKTGDSLDKIARAHQTTITKLKEMNALNSDKIVVGQSLVVPAR